MGIVVCHTVASMKSLADSNDPVVSIAFSPSFLRHFLNMPPLQAWNMFGGDVPQLSTDGELPEYTAILTFKSGLTRLVNRDWKRDQSTHST
jgi:hypothetical protein